MTTKLRVIGTGFGRTGTDSMRVALEMLGFGPCHHMRELLADEEHKMKWRQLEAGNSPGWDALLGSYGACVDWPSAAYWPRLIEDFPEAKVLLTWRTAESWWASFEKTILPIITENPETVAAPAGSQLLSKYVFGGKPMTRDHCIATYEANVAKVKATVPADRLLVYKIGDGWEPLCAFLEVDVPAEPFPRTNNQAQFHEMLDELENR